MSRKKKTRRPLTISIHGEALDIEAKFNDSKLADVLTEALSRASSLQTPKTPGTPTGSALAALLKAIYEFNKSLRSDQVELLMNAFDMPQKELFIKIINAAISAHPDAN